MAGVHLISLIAALVTVAGLVEMLRRRQIRQKYAITWMVVGLGVAAVAVFPDLFNDLAHALGVISPPDLLAVLAALFLLLVTVHMSWELGRLEDRSRLLAEEIALLRADLEERDAAAARPGPARVHAPAAPRSGEPAADDGPLTGPLAQG